MGKLVTTNFNTHNAKQFVESINETANSIYYVTLGNHRNPSSVVTSNNSQEAIMYQTYRDMIYGKHVTPNDVKHMIDNNIWTSGTKYAQYDNNDGDLQNKKFYAHVKEANGTFSVFKCLYNNKGAASTDEPTALETSADDDVYITTADKYQWKLMYQIEETDYNKFATSEKVPVFPNANVSGNAVAGAIDVVNVNTGGSRYHSVANGVIKVAQVGGNTRIFELESLASANVTFDQTDANNSGTFTVERVDLFDEDGSTANPDTSNNVANAVIMDVDSTNKIIRVQDIAGDFFGQQSNVIMKGQTSGATAKITDIASSTSSLSANTDFYKDSIFYIAAGAGKGAAAPISEYIVTGSARRVLLANDIGFSSVDSTSLFEISPSVTITGDGTGAEARAIVNTSIFAIDTVEVTKRGSGYTFAEATIVGNTGISGDATANNANVNIIIGPPGGHGSDVINELFADSVGISVDYLDDNGGFTPAVNDFSQISILKDPLYSNVVISITDTTVSGGGSGGGTSFTANEVLTQNNSTASDKSRTGAFGVIKARFDSTINVSNVYGQFFNTTSGDANTRIVGGSSGTSAEIASFKTSDKDNSTFDLFDQRIRLGGFINTSSFAFQTDEKIIQDSTDAEGFIHNINTSSSVHVLEITNKKGNFLVSEESGEKTSIRGQTSGAVGYFTSVAGPDIVPNSGEVIYTENITPITRDNAQTERLKVIVKF